MIEWLKEKFEMWVSILFKLCVIGWGLSVGILWAIRWGFLGFLLGAVIGCIFGLILGIVFYGLSATIICILKSSEANTKLLENTNSLLAEIKSCADTMKNKLNALDEISSKLNSVGAAKDSDGSASSKDETSASNMESTKNKAEAFDIVCINGKMLAVKDDAAGKYFCPKCHAQVMDTDFYCGSCNARLSAN